jgi:CHAT domain-containing protein
LRGQRAYPDRDRLVKRRTGLANGSTQIAEEAAIAAQSMTTLDAPPAATGRPGGGGGAPWLLLHAGILLAALALLILCPIEDTQPESAEAEYNQAARLFQRGYLEQAQREAELGVRRFQRTQPDWAVRFKLLEAETLVRRGLNPDALELLQDFKADPQQQDQQRQDQHKQDPQKQEETVRALTIEASALPREQLALANKKLDEAAALCRAAEYGACVDVLRVRAIVASRGRDFAGARAHFVESLEFARRHKDRWAELGAEANAGWASMKLGRMEKAVASLSAAHDAAVAAGTEYWAELAGGNLGWTYYELGDDDKALPLFLEAEKTAAKIGGQRDERLWISAEGGVYRDREDNAGAERTYKKALALARTMRADESTEQALEDLALLAVVTNHPDAADGYVRQATPLETADGGKPSAYLMLTEGQLAAERGQNEQAVAIFDAILGDQANPVPTRLEAGLDRARVFEREGRNGEAERGYRATLGAFEQAREQLQNVDSRLPFAVNGDRIYDGYIHFLVKQGRSDAALEQADQSRARALAETLGAKSGANTGNGIEGRFDPRVAARATGATLLFYWMGEEQSYLWAVTGARVNQFLLPPEAEILARVKRYSAALLDIDDPLEARNEDGQALYQTLIAPAAGLIKPETPVVVLADGELNRLNFETLLAGRDAGLHYWIDDATVLSAPSIAMLAAGRTVETRAPRLLMVGDPETARAEFPRLPLFGVEMKTVGGHFDAANVTSLEGRAATPRGYLTSDPGRYAYIHFVAHAVASRKEPLDSAIILSDPDGGRVSAAGKTDASMAGEAFRLSAREIMQHRMDARLVTISSCSGSGVRAYPGEGLVGLSWAFLHAGAQSVIGALWEASDDSTPRLMDALYGGIAGGQTPAAALRQAKLAMLRSGGRFRSPFYWAPFRLTTRN